MENEPSSSRAVILASFSRVVCKTVRIAGEQVSSLRWRPRWLLSALLLLSAVRLTTKSLLRLFVYEGAGERSGSEGDAHVAQVFH